MTFEQGFIAISRINVKTKQAINQAVHMWQPLERPDQQHPFGSYNSKQTEVMEYIEKYLGLSNPMGHGMPGMTSRLRIPAYARDAMNQPPR